MIDKIENLYLIDSIELRSDICKIYDDVIEVLSKYNDILKAKNEVNSLLYCYVMSVGKPCAIADSSIEYTGTGLYEMFIINLLVNYQVTYGYKPYQELDKPIKLCFYIRQNDLISYKRDKKLNQIGI